MGPGGRRLVASAIAAFVGLLLVAPAAQATFHLMSIREVYAGSAVAPQSSYVELQMYADGQEQVGGHSVTIYNASGAQIAGSPFTFPSALGPFGSSHSQQTILIGDDGVAAAFGVTPDLTSANFNVPAVGGAACWDTIDCVAWGNFTGSVGSAVGTPVDSLTGIQGGVAIRRKISGGTCTNLLDGADDSGNSATDFADTMTPAPTSYATVPGAASCLPAASPPTSIIDSKPAAATNSQSAAFTFHSNPAGAGFECRIDSDPFDDCDSGSAAYPGPLTEGSHTFQVKATDANGTGPTASYTWTVDRTPPDTTITQHPVDPSPGATSTFKFSSSQGGSHFECKLTPVDKDLALCSSPKTYSNLQNGQYTFEVRAIDPAGNVDPSPDSFSWIVNNSVADTTPPETTITAKPTDPDPTPTAAFSYASNESNSTFECKLDGGAFTACQATGIVYTDLAAGSHSFQVRATDASHNTDPTPAGYTFTVPVAGPSPQLDPPQTTIVAKPPPKTRDRTPTFRFRASLTNATFECKLDKAPFKPCRSPFTTKALSIGRHAIKVRAVVGGVEDPTPAGYGFKVVKRR